MEGDLPTFVLRLAGLVVALFIMYALTESRFGRATTFVAFVGGVALIALGNFAVFSLAGPETFLRFYPLTGNVAAFALLLGIARQRPLVVAFTILTAIQLNAVIGMLGHAASLTVDPTRALAVNLAVRAVLAVPLVWATFRFFRPYYLEAARTMRRGWGLLCLIPLAFYALFYIVYIVGAVEGEGMRIAIVMLALAMALAGYAIVFVALREHARRTQLAEAQRLLEEQARAFERQIEAVRASDEKMRLLRHDLRHHLGIVATLVRAGEDEEALAALGGVDEAVEEAAVRRWCENAGVNALLDLYLGRAMAAGVQVEASCDVPRDLPVNALEFAGVCANAVENAAAACADQPAGERRRIAVRIASEPRLALEVENTCCGTVPLNSEGLPEPQRPGHGVGMRSIAAFAERHGAHLTCEAAEGMFRLRLVLPQNVPSGSGSHPGY